MTEALTSRLPCPPKTPSAEGLLPRTPAVLQDPAAAAGCQRQTDVEAAVHAIADRSRHAARKMARANRAWKDRGLRAIGKALLEHKGQILAANAKDVAAGTGQRTPAPHCWTA